MRAARDIAFALAGRRAQRLGNGGYLVPCPVPSHGAGRGDRNPSLEIRDGNCALLVRCYAGCDSRDVLDELRRRGLLDRQQDRPAPGRPSSPATSKPTDHEIEQSRKATWLWQRRQPIVGSIAEKYLRNVRGYTGPLPPTLGYLPPRKEGQHPAMIAAFGLVTESEPGVLAEPGNVAAIHLTLVKPDGSGKADIEQTKIMVGSPLGKPIVLAAPHDGYAALGITEGVEDALSAYQAIGQAAWASGAAGFMPALADCVPSYFESVTIFAHDDPAGRRFAKTLAQRLTARGIAEVLIEGLT
jgi:hypothetical protein